jgi:hypothetical protein
VTIRNIAAALGLVIAAATIPTVAGARTSFNLSIGPPAPIVEPVPMARPGYTWSPGYWTWQGERYEWIAGNWMHDRPGYTWEPHHWVHNDDHWQLQHGQWNADPHGGPGR